MSLVGLTRVSLDMRHTEVSKRSIEIGLVDHNVRENAHKFPKGKCIGGYLESLRIRTDKNQPCKQRFTRSCVVSRQQAKLKENNNFDGIVKITRFLDLANFCGSIRKLRYQDNKGLRHGISSSACSGVNLAVLNHCVK